MRRHLPLVCVLLAASLTALSGCTGRRAEPGSVPVDKPAQPREARLLAALEAVEDGRYQEAVRTLEGILASPPAPAEAYSLLGLAYMQLEGFDEAETTLREGRNRHPRDPAIAKAFSRLFFVRARQALESGKRELARDEFLRAVAESPEMDRTRSEVDLLYRRLALGLVQVGKADNALGLLADLRGMGFRSDAATVIEAGALARLGRGGEATRRIYGVDPRTLEDPDVRALYAELGGRGGGGAAPDPGSLLTRAREELERGATDEALRLVQRGLAGAGGEPELQAAYLAVAFQAAYDAKDYTAARRHASERLRLRPGDVEASLDYGRILTVMGAREEARNHYETALARRPGEPRIRLAWAGYLLSTGDVGTAETQLLSLLDGHELVPELEARAYELLGITCVRKDDYDCAENWWLRKEGVDPGDAKTYFNLGQLYQKRRRYREAVEHFERSVEASGEKDPNFVKYLYWLGLGYRQNGQNREMVRTFQRILVLAPPSDSYRSQARKILDETGNRSDACPVELPRDPSHPVAQGWARLEGGDDRGAQEAFRRSLAANPTASVAMVAHQGLGMVARRRDRLARAAFHFEQAGEKGHSDCVRMELASTFFDLGLFRRSLETWRSIRRSKQVDRARVRFEIARCLDRLGRAEKAMEAYEEALSLAPDSMYAGTARMRLEELVPAFLAPADAASVAPSPAPGLTALAAVHLENGEAAAAERLLGEALEASSDHVPALIELGRLRRVRGDLAGAEELFQRAVATSPDSAEAHLELALLVLEVPERLQDGYLLLARAREIGGPAGAAAAREMVQLYRDVGQEEDARIVLEELARGTDTPAEIRDWAQEQLEPDRSGGGSPPPAGGPGE